MLAALQDGAQNLSPFCDTLLVVVARQTHNSTATRTRAPSATQDTVNLEGLLETCAKAVGRNPC